MGVLDTAEMERRRKARKLTQSEAAKLAGLGTPQKWSDIVRGRRGNITLETLESIAKALGCKPGELLK